MKIFGRNAVSEALASGMTMDRLAAAKGQKDAGAERIISAARSRGVKIQFLDTEVLDRESGGKKHQGFIADVTDYKYCGVEDILAAAEAKNEPPFVVILDGVEDPHNLGSVLRVAECGGVHGVIIPARRAVNVNETVIRVSAGAAAHVKVARVNNINDTIRGFKERGIFVYAADASGENIYKTDFRSACAVVVGGEDTGVKRLSRELCDKVVALPVFGKINSLNASVACGVTVYEIIRQRAL